MKQLQCDIIIVGGGLSGLLGAYALSFTNQNLIIIDKNDFVNKNQLLKDFRTTAIAEGSKIYFEKINLWNSIKKYVEPIKKINVFDRQETNTINFYNPDNNSFLGYVIQNKLLKKTLIRLLKLKKNVRMIGNTSLKDITYTNNSIDIITNLFKIQAKLVVASDGKTSFVRKIIKTPLFSKKYHQNATVVNLHHLKNHKNIAYELFLNSGPLAILPMKVNSNNFYASSVIWSNSHKFTSSLELINQALAKDIIEEKIFKYSGKVLKILDIKSFNLSAHINNRFYDHRITYVGDAAHSLHPIAGQGWNLGIRDIKNLVHSINRGINLGLDIGDEYVCKEYHNLSFYDAYFMFQVTDKLNSIFLREDHNLPFLRKIGFMFIENNFKIKNYISGLAMGI